ncbi:MAG TPA: GMC family oxidoreductase N-terminal domain-containing protein [Candidatus Limnocylindrales bacterium]|nr:GMC family oxidoreductase N-terminal domain-containing protein [Candidatus Limnocylindrales bacterium]
MTQGNGRAQTEATDAWTEREQATLAEVAEAFVRGDALRRSRLGIEALDRAADPAQVRQLRLVLRILDSRLANLVLTRQAIRFSARSPAERERYLLAWAHSRFPLRRSAFQAFRKLFTFLAYADPGVAAPNPRLEAIGYRPDEPPLAATPAPITPSRPPFETGFADEPMELEADVVVVGAGAAGGVVAADLARAGRAVVVLEAGPFVDETTMPRNELDAFGRLYLNYGLLTTWDGSVTMLAGTAVGGGTLVNWMTCIGAPDWILDEWQREHGIDGLTGAEWAADGAAIDVELRVTETTEVPPKDAAILRGAAALGWDAAPTRRNAAGCRACGSCPFGCRQGSKQSGIRGHLADAVAAGARIVPRVRVTRVLFEGGRAVGVEANALWTDPHTGEPEPVAPGAPPRIRTLLVRARSVVLAAGALRTPAILEGSGLDHPAIGRNLRVHPVPIVAGFFADPIDMWSGPMQGARSLEFARPAPGRNGYIIESAPGHPGLLALALPWEGTDAHADIMLGARRIAPLVAVTRDGGAGRVRLLRSGRVRLDYRLDADGVRTLRHALVSMARLSRAAGANQIVAVGTPPVWHGRGGFLPGHEGTGFAWFEKALGSFDLRPNRGGVFSAHQMGTARMGAYAGRHACDPRGRVRAGASRSGGAVVGGLYVADGSLFPTGLGVNPMITIMTLARRVARTVAAET